MFLRWQARYLVNTWIPAIQRMTRHRHGLQVLQIVVSVVCSSSCWVMLKHGCRFGFLLCFHRYCSTVHSSDLCCYTSCLLCDSRIHNTSVVCTRVSHLLLPRRFVIVATLFQKVQSAVSTHQLGTRWPVDIDTKHKSGGSHLTWFVLKIIWTQQEASDYFASETANSGRVWICFLIFNPEYPLISLQEEDGPEHVQVPVECFDHLAFQFDYLLLCRLKVPLACNQSYHSIKWWLNWLL